MATEYDIDIRELEPTYKHTLARQAGREVDDGRTVHLRELAVTLRLNWGTGSDRNGQTFTVSFRVDHEDELVRTHAVKDAHGDVQSFGVQRLAAATAAAEQAAGGFLADVDLNHYDLIAGYDQFTDARSTSDSVAVHTNLEVHND